MKKHVSVAARLIVAVLGIAYIVWAVDWQDQVEVPAGSTLVVPGSVAVGFEHEVVPGSEDGVRRVKLAEATKFKVVQGSHRRGEVEGEIHFQVGTVDGKPYTRPVPAAELDAADGRVRFLPGIFTTLRDANRMWLLMGLALVGTIYPIQSFRWLTLMRCRGLGVTAWKAYRLTMVGSFFNYCMPGTTGGDLIKAYYAAKHSDRRAEAVMSVVFDRVAGLLGLVVLAGVTGLFMIKHPLAGPITVYVWLGMGCAALGAGVYFSRRTRKALRIDWLISKLPGKGLFASIDQAAVAYRDHWGAVVSAVAVSLPVHLALAAATALSGYALGMETSIGLLLVVIPLCFLAAAVPIAPQGLGVMEVFAITMLADGTTALPNQIVGMLLLIRLYQVVYCVVLGSVFLLKGDIHLHPERVQQDSPLVADGVPAGEAVAAVAS